MTTSSLDVEPALRNGAPGPPGRAPNEVDRFVLAVRLLGYLGRHEHAVELATDALTAHPRSARLLRLRGEKRLLVGDIGGAVADLEAAVERLADEPDHPEYLRDQVEHDVLEIVLGRGGANGPPPASLSGAPVDGAAVDGGQRDRSTLGAVTWHHLGIARYLLADFDTAADAFARSQRAGGRDHVYLAAVDWRYLALRRSGRDAEAAASLRCLDAIDLWRCRSTGDVASCLDDSYRQRLRMYRGELGPEELLRNDTASPLALATLGYGVGAWYLLRGYLDAAAAVWRRVLELGDRASSGVLAAEADLRRR